MLKKIKKFFKKEDNIDIFIKGMNYSLNKCLQTLDQIDSDANNGTITDHQAFGAKRYLTILRRGMESSIIDYKKLQENVEKQKEVNNGET